MIEIQLNESPDIQVSLTDPDARSMKTRGTGIVGYNVQTAVETKNQLDTTIYQLEKTLKDAGDKLPADVKSKFETAIAEAKKYCKVNVVADAAAGNYTHVPRQSEWQRSANAAKQIDGLIVTARRADRRRSARSRDGGRSSPERCGSSR